MAETLGVGGVFIFLIILAIFIGIPWWVRKDAIERGSDHGLAWAAMTFVSFVAIVGVIPYLIFYFRVADDIGKLQDT